VALDAFAPTPTVLATLIFSSPGMFSFVRRVFLQDVSTTTNDPPSMRADFADSTENASALYKLASIASQFYVRIPTAHIRGFFAAPARQEKPTNGASNYKIALFSLTIVICRPRYIDFGDLLQKHNKGDGRRSAIFCDALT